MHRYLAESIKGIFESIPLDGALIIVGGEEFQHCFMRPSGVEIRHTNCARCEKLGAETVVADLCNGLAQAAREANPEAVLVAWPYSAKHFWSADDDQIAFIQKLKPGTALLTEIEKDETLVKEGGVKKAIWDYSIDLIGPTERAKRQIAACKAAGVEVYLKSEPELAFEAPGLPYIPCVDRWFDRANALAASGADGAWVIAWFRPNLGTTSAEVYKYAWWNPAPDRETLLAMLAKRIAGTEQAAAHLRRAWKYVSAAIPWSPELPPYFVGPYYLGPCHPMCADREAELPACFKTKSVEGVHVLTEARGDVEVFGRYYRKMERALHEAVQELDAAAPDVPSRSLPVFRAEVLPTRWFYHTARTHANFYESCQLRDFLLPFAKRGSKNPQEIADTQTKCDRWRAVLEDERENTKAAIAVVKQDSRLDVHNTKEGVALAPAKDLMHKKLELLDHELKIFLPSVVEKWQEADPTVPFAPCDSLGKVYFDYNSATLTSPALATLAKAASYIKANPKFYRIEGHCDERGTQDYNLALGDKRAQTVRNHLIRLGVPGNSLTSMSYGKEKPAKEGHDESAWKFNRRCEFSMEVK